MKYKNMAMLECCQYTVKGIQTILTGLSELKLAGVISSAQGLKKMLQDKNIDITVCGIDPCKKNLSKLLFVPTFSSGVKILLTNKPAVNLKKVLLCAGFDMVVSKQTSLNELERTLHKALTLESRSNNSDVDGSLFTAKERIVLSGYVSGMKTTEISECLNMSSATIRRHKKNALLKSGMKKIQDFISEY